MAYFYKYFFYFKNWGMIDHTGFRDISRRILSYAMQIRIVKVIGQREGSDSEWTDRCDGGGIRPTAISI